MDGKAKFIHTDGRVNIMRYFDTLTSVIIGQVLTESHLKKTQKDKLETNNSQNTNIYIYSQAIKNPVRFGDKKAPGITDQKCEFWRNFNCIV